MYHALYISMYKKKKGCIVKYECAVCCLSRIFVTIGSNE